MQQALPLLRWYATATEPLRRAHTLDGWIDVLAHWIGLARAAFPPQATVNAADYADWRLWDRLQSTLRKAAEAEVEVAAQPARLTATEFLAEFRDLIAAERLDPPAEPAGCVRVLSFDQLRHVTVPHLFLVGLTEESFPRRRSDDCLFTDAERERLSVRGVSLLHHARHQQEEMFFFYSLMLRAGQRLTITHPEIDQHGQPVFASPYLASLRALFAREALPVLHEGQLDPVPPPEQAVSQSETRLMAMDAALSGKAGWLRSLAEVPATRPVVANLLGAVEMATQRFHTKGFTVYEGRLELDAHRAALADRFGPRRQFSATELEAYATCPFRFWLETVLGIAPLSEPTTGTDHIQRGHIVHAVLAELLTPMVAGTPSATLAEQFRNLVAERLDRQPTNTELQRALTRIERTLLHDWAAAYANQVESYAEIVDQSWSGSWSAAPPELPFGDVPGEEPAPEQPRYPPLSLGTANRQVLVRGRIDRIDFGAKDGQSMFTVIDYKTGRRPRFSLEEVESGRALQLALYTLAVQRLGITPADAAPFQLGYWCLRETGFRTGISPRRDAPVSPLDTAVWQTLVQTLEETIPRLATGIRAGEFVVHNDDPNCTGMCPFNTVCRVNQVRNVAELQQKWRPVAAQPETVAS